MREIKFRAWAISSQKMFYPDIQDGWEIFNGVINPLPNTYLMQFTGLKDKNAKDIYEGDIMGIGEVYWSCFHGGFILLAKTFEHTMPFAAHHYVVRGNIYENPELVK